MLSRSGHRIVLIGFLALHVGTGACAAELLSLKEVFGAIETDGWHWLCQ